MENNTLLIYGICILKLCQVGVLELEDSIDWYIAPELAAEAALPGCKTVGDVLGSLAGRTMPCRICESCGECSGDEGRSECILLRAVVKKQISRSLEDFANSLIFERLNLPNAEQNGVFLYCSGESAAAITAELKAGDSGRLLQKEFAEEVLRLLKIAADK